MRLINLLKSGGLAALVAAMTVTALPAQAAQETQRGWSDSERQNRSERRQQARVQNNRGERAQARQQARQVDRRTERRAERVENRGDRAAAQAAARGNIRQAERIDRRSEREAVRIERNGDRRAAQIRQEARRDNRDRNIGERRGVVYSDNQERERQREWRDRNNNRGWGDRDRNDRNWRDSDRNNGRNWRDNDRNWRDNGRNWRDNDRNWRNDRRDYRRWDNRNWRNDRRYDWNRHRTNNRRLYSIGRYYAPYSNYSYRRVGIGFSLDSLFFGNRYWISDPYQYRLPEVYGPYRWVRYYDDVLLVDTYSGEVVDVIYDFFW
jgi:hypothetical protein